MKRLVIKGGGDLDAMADAVAEFAEEQRESGTERTIEALRRLAEYNKNHDRLGKFARANSPRGGFGTTGNLPLDAATGLDALQRGYYTTDNGYGTHSTSDAEDQVADLDQINREDFGIGTDELVEHAAGNYFDLADAAMKRGKNEVGGAMRAAQWYGRAGNLARTLARSHGLTKAKVAAVMSISSANDDWKINARKTAQWAKAMGDKRPIPISKQQIEYAARLKHGKEWRKLVKTANRAAKKELGVSKLTASQKEAVQKSVAKSAAWRTVANPTIAKWKAEGATSGKHNVDSLMKHKDGIELSVAGLSSHNAALQKGRTGLPNFRSGDMAMKTMEIYRGDDPSGVITSFKVQQKNGLYLPGMKTRQFFNNIMHNGKGRGSTQDAHMAMAALAGKRWKKGSHKGKPVVFASSGPAYGAGTRKRAYGGRYPALAEANKKARVRFNRKYKTRFTDAQFQALVWSEKKRLDGTPSPRGGKAPYNKTDKRSAWDDWREERESRP